MKTNWDYTSLADAYLKRPEYSKDALSALFSHVDAQDTWNVCDVGAGCAHLTLELAGKGFSHIDAVEPNDAMRANGKKRTEQFTNVDWFEGVGEETTRPDSAYELVTFGSSFNVCDRQKALEETKRILKPGGWFACMWNHRVLEDPIQTEIENIIKKYKTDYNYGTRRQDQTEVINESNLFNEVKTLEGTILHTQTIEDCIEAWRSHGTLHRELGDENFAKCIDEISTYLNGLGKDAIEIPYTTRMWVAQLKN